MINGWEDGYLKIWFCGEEEKRPVTRAAIGLTCSEKRPSKAYPIGRAENPSGVQYLDGKILGDNREETKNVSQVIWLIQYRC